MTEKTGPDGSAPVEFVIGDTSFVIVDDDKKEEQVAQVKLRISTYRSAIAAKNRIVEEVGDELLLKKQFKEAADRNVELSKKQTALDSRRQVLLPEYQKAVQSELRERSASLKEEVTQSEFRAGELERALKEAQELLSSTSSKYKEETSRRDLCVSKMRDLLQVLREKLAEKLSILDHRVGLRLDRGGGGGSEESPFLDVPEHEALLECITGMHRAREHMHSSVQSEKRELQAICAFRSEQVVLLEEEAKVRIAEARQQKDQSIRDAVYAMQDERNLLLADIEEIRRVNQDQSVHLRRGHVLTKAPEKQKKSIMGGTPNAKVPQHHADANHLKISDGLQLDVQHLLVASPISTRFSKLKKEEPAPPELQLIRIKNKELRDEINTSRDHLDELHKLRTELTKQKKQFEGHLKRDKDSFESELAKLNSITAATLAQVLKTEKENSRLTDVVQHLAIMLRTTKKQIDHVRARTEPLPVE